MSRLRAPFPWFGGKSRVAPIVWDALGDVPNYVEPFAGSLAVLLARPSPPRVETVNDSNALLTNLWRALKAAPEDVVRHAIGPLHEVDLHARHGWLVALAPQLRERLLVDPDAFDARAAGWWLWGACGWLGSGWCTSTTPRRQLPDLGGDSGARGRGVLASGKTEEEVRAWLHRLARRLSRVAVTCGDWTRVCTKAVTWGTGVTGLVLDPPYPEGAGDLYADQERTTWVAARDWAVENGDNPNLRIVLCGYEGMHTMPASWRCVAWKASGGYASAAGNSAGARRERLWFSPHCLGARQSTLALWSAP